MRKRKNSETEEQEEEGNESGIFVRMGFSWH